MIRLTGGDLRGRTLLTPKVEAHKEETTRPTTDRVRESLFNILAHHDWATAFGEDSGLAVIDSLFENAVVLDAFAGTGALGFDALSRGAKHAYFIERDTQSFAVLKENTARLKLEARATLFQKNATNPPPAPAPCTLIFLDPPYRKKLIPSALHALETQGWIAPKALIVAETAKDEGLELAAPYRQVLTRAYGETCLSFFVRVEKAAS